MKETKEMYPSWGDDHGVRLGNVKISDLHDFKKHPFHVVEDTALFELTKSIEDKVADRVVNVVHKKIVEKEVPVLKEEPEQAVVV